MNADHQMEIVILTHNRRLYLERMILSIMENTRYPCRIIIVDNASAEDTKQYLRFLLREHNVSRVFFNQRNVFHHGWQTGIDATEGDMIVLSDPDIVVPEIKPCWLTRMVTLMEKYPGIGKLGARINLPTYSSPAHSTESWCGPSCLRPLPGPPLSPDGEVYRQYVDTTLHIMRKSIYPDGKMQGDLEGGSAGLPRRYVPGTIEAVARDIVVDHLGWNDVRDYPDYFYKKLDSPHVFRSRSEYWALIWKQGVFSYMHERISQSVKWRIKNYLRKKNMPLAKAQRSPRKNEKNQELFKKTERLGEGKEYNKTRSV